MKLTMGLATILTGLLAGGTVDRFVVQFPAWRHMDVTVWANYSRHADLGNGIFLYPFEAIGGFLLLAIACIQAYPHRIDLRWPTRFTYIAAILSALGLVFTIFAAPVMLSLKNGINDITFLQNAFDQFYYWSFFRAVVQVLSFFFCIAAISSGFRKST